MHIYQDFTRCFPHIVNLAIKAGLQRLTKPPPKIDTYSNNKPSADELLLAENKFLVYDDSFEDDDDNDNVDIDKVHAALGCDVVDKVRKLANAIRKSGLRRNNFQDVIVEGNMSGSFGEAGLRQVNVLKDMDVRWSSTFLMIDRMLELYPVCSFLIQLLLILSDIEIQAVKVFIERDENQELRVYALSKAEENLLSQIHDFLLAAHSVQEIVSVEKTPTLPYVLPQYEKLLQSFHLLRLRYPLIAHAIDVSIAKLEPYIKKARATRAYHIAVRK
jgi:hypothetical protein